MLPNRPDDEEAGRLAGQGIDGQGHPMSIAEPLRLEKPPIRKTDPWAHQDEPYHFIISRVASMLAMSMGTGKTKVVIDAICNSPDVSKVLVICPLPVMPVSPREFERHAIAEMGFSNS